MKPADQRIYNLEQSIQNLQTELANVRKESIEAARELPGKLEASHQTLLGKQTWILGIFNFVFAGLSIVIAVWSFNSFKNTADQLREDITKIEELKKETERLLEALRFVPKQAYKKLRDEEIKSALDDVEKDPKSIEYNYQKLISAPTLSLEYYRSFAAKATGDPKTISEPSRGLFEKLVVKNYWNEIIENDNPEQLSLLEKIFVQSYFYDDDAALAVIRKLMESPITPNRKKSLVQIAIDFSKTYSLATITDPCKRLPKTYRVFVDLPQNIVDEIYNNSNGDIYKQLRNKRC